jgi:monoamine oxidase
VRRIEWRRGSVTVETVSPDGAPLTFRARSVIVTLPVGVLQHRGDDRTVVFEPVLPAPKEAALRSIAMGHVVKVAMRFRSAFWERLDGGRYRDAGFFRCAGGPFAVYWTQRPLPDDVVVAWVGGPGASALRGLREAAVVDRAVDGFGRLFGEAGIARRELESGLMHDWSSDPFARGAYSYLKVGAGSARAALAASVDQTLFFAGEATSSDGQGGTVNGALATGERAAREASRALGAEDEIYG